MKSASMNLRYQSEVEERPQKSLNEKQQQYQDLLIRCVAQHLLLSKGKPVAACIIYKCLRQWGSFEVERTSIFDRIIQTIGHAIEVPAICLSLSKSLNRSNRFQREGAAAAVAEFFRYRYRPSIPSSTQLKPLELY